MPPKPLSKKGKENVVPKRTAKDLVAEDDFDSTDGRNSSDKQTWTTLLQRRRHGRWDGQQRFPKCRVEVGMMTC